MSTDPPASASWPVLSYDAFAPTQYLLHRMTQVLGKLTLTGPFHAQWAHVALPITPRGLRTGPIHTDRGVYEVEMDVLNHELRWTTSWETSGARPLGPTSVADFTSSTLASLHAAGIDATIDLMPQEVTDPVAFDHDDTPRPYDADLVTDWWRILVDTHRVFNAFQGRFTGKTQPIGLMWGTFDIRLVLYNGTPVMPPAGTDYIRRNAMNEELIEVGWWSGDPRHSAPAFYSFTFPQPNGIEGATIGPKAAEWSTDMGEFLLDYDDLRATPDPDAALMQFVETTYAAGATAGGWAPTLLGDGKPI